MLTVLDESHPTLSPALSPSGGDTTMMSDD